MKEEKKEKIGLPGQVALQKDEKCFLQEYFNNSEIFKYLLCAG